MVQVDQQPGSGQSDRPVAALAARHRVPMAPSPPAGPGPASMAKAWFTPSVRSTMKRSQRLRRSSSQPATAVRVVPAAKGDHVCESE
jgi:hypothetical protein